MPSDLTLRIRREAMENGGMVTFPFAQGDAVEGLKVFYGMFDSTSGGICDALSLYWIAHHAMDAGFWDWLFDAGAFQRTGGTQLIRRMGSVFRVLELQSLRSQRAITAEEFLARYHVVAHQKMDAASVMIRSVMGPTSTTEAHSFHSNPVKLLLQLTEGGATWDSYKYIRFGSGTLGSVGHACAAFVSRPRDGLKANVLYFDPNHGEFFFDDLNLFEGWFITYIVTCDYLNTYPRAAVQEFGVQYRGSRIR